MDIYFNQITLCRKSKDNSNLIILDNVSGLIPAGKLTCILGPSGCGKTSLLNVLALRIKPTSGYVRLQNSDISDNNYNRKQIAYVIQDDVLLPNIRLYEYLKIYCSLNGFHQQHIKSIMEFYLESFNLGLCKDVFTQALSGGQRKRLSIALELLRNPSVIYLDEPTSGLDSPNALQCIRIIKKLANRGKTVCCSIHQPSSAILSYFDQIIVIANGSIICHGTLPSILQYLSSIQLNCPKYYNPGDFFLELAYGDYYSISYLVDHWKNNTSENTIDLKNSLLEYITESYSDTSINNLNDPILMSTTSELFLENNKNMQLNNIKRICILSIREFQCMYRDWFLLTTKFFSNIFIGLLICLIYYKIGDDGNKIFDNIGCLFFSMIFIMFIGLMPTVLTFPLEKICVIREHKNYWYSLGSYYLSKTIAELPFNFVNPIIFTSIVYFISGQPPHFKRYGKFTFTLILLSQISQSLGLLIGTLAPSTSVAVFVAPIIGIPLLLFCGYFISVSSINKYVRWITYITFGKYGWENILLSIYGDNRYFRRCSSHLFPYNLSDPHDYSSTQFNFTQYHEINQFYNHCSFKNGMAVLNFFDLNETVNTIQKSKFLLNSLILIQFVIVIRLVTYIFLKIVVRMTVI